jgi:hypothetical protein
MYVVCFVVAFAGFLRYSDLASILVHQQVLEVADSHLRFLLPHSKTDQRWEGTWVTVKASTTAACPVRLVRWLLQYGGYVTNATSVDCGPLLRAVDRKAGPYGALAQVTAPLQACIKPLSSDTVLRHLRRLLGTVMIDKQVGTHSLRIGAATEAEALGVPRDVARAQGRWRSAQVHEQYIRGPSAAAPNVLG